MKKSKLHLKQDGYTMLAMIAGLTITLVVLAAAAAAPSAQFQSQRENEEEAIYRGLQVAHAIESFANMKGGLAPQNLPTKLEELTNEINFNGRPLHLVRSAAMVDPLTNKDWKPVRLGDPIVKDFARAFMQEMARQQTANMASGGTAAQQTQTIPALLTMAMQVGGISVTNLNSDEETLTSRGSSMTGFSLGGDSDSRPIIGVISTSKKKMIRNYYGVESYDKAIFINGAAPNNANFSFPSFGGVPAGAGDGSDQGTSPYKGPTMGPCQRTGIRDPRCDGK